MLKPVERTVSSKADLQRFPDPVQGRMGFAFCRAQLGRRHRDAKTLRGFGPGVVEVVARHDGDTFRAACTVRFGGAVHVRHAFEKKAKRGIATPKQQLDLVRRLAAAERHCLDTQSGV